MTPFRFQTAQNQKRQKNVPKEYTLIIRVQTPVKTLSGDCFDYVSKINSEEEVQEFTLDLID